MMMFRKCSAVAVILLFIGVCVVPATATPLDDDVEIEIYAGVYEKTEGRIGLGFVISMCNNLNETINGTIEISSNNLRDQNVRLQQWSFTLSSHHPLIKFNGIDWIHFPYPIITLTITVETVGLIVSRSGMEIGPMVIFESN